MKIVSVKMKKDSNVPTPAYKTIGSAGADICANETVEILPGEIKMVKTGIYLEIPPGYEVQMRPRSGLAAKHGITVLNTPGTIDSDYRGELIAILINHGKETYTIKRSERIGQLVLSPVYYACFVETTELEESIRGSEGFGSTGY